MPDLATERAHLAQAERDIAEGEKRIFRQEELLAHLRSQDQSTTEAETLLRVLQETLEGWTCLRQIHELELLDEFLWTKIIGITNIRYGCSNTDRRSNSCECC